MGIYHPSIEEKLLNCPVEENILHEYDNYTYHIQFYMIPKAQLETYESMMSQGLDGQSILENSKYIIAESGVTNSIFVESLEMDTVPPTNYSNNSISTIKMDLKLEEVGGCSLVNKIALCSKVCGYDSYVLQKYFISIWFTGYRNNHYTQGDVETVIGGQKYTYEVTLANVKSVMESNKTSYSIEMYPQYYPSLTQDSNRLIMCSEILMERSWNLQQCLNEFNDRLNKQLEKLLGKSVYNYIYGDSENASYEIILTEPLGDDFYNKNERTVFGPKGDVGIINGVPVGSQKAEELSNELGVSYGRHQIKNYESKNFTKSSLKDGFIVDATASILITPTNEDTIQTLIRKIVSLFPNIMQGGFDYVLENRDVLVKSYQGINWYKHVIYVNIIKVPGLFSSYKASKDNTYDDYIYKPIQTQELYLYELFKNNSLNKRYYWLLNNKNIDVLSIKRNEDQLWYLNYGLSCKNDILENLTDDTNKLNIIMNSPEINNKEEEFNNYVSKLKRKDGTIYVDDIYELYLKADTNVNVDSMFSIGMTSSLTEFYKNESITENPDTAEKEKLTKNESLQNQNNSSMLGYKNLFRAGQKLDIDIDILGDPYWLLFNSENIGLHNLPYMLPHIVVCMKSYTQPDGMDNYKEDVLMTINTLYVVTEIKSVFQNGVFTQKLIGVLALPFKKSSVDSNSEQEKKFDEYKRNLERQNGPVMRAMTPKEQSKYELEKALESPPKNMPMIIM